MFWFDPLYFLFIAPGVLLALFAEFRVKSAYSRASRIGNSRAMSGRDAARRVLDANGLQNVGIEESHGVLSDHYDPKAAILRLSRDVYNGRSIASVGIAAHEAGHALQHAKGYGPLRIRSALVPMAMTGGQLSMLLIMVGLGLMVGMRSSMGAYMLYAGIGLFSVTVLFQIVNLPVEFDASRRARVVLAENGILSHDEMPEVGRVLNAAALTYVAATITAILTLLYYLYRAGLIGGRRD